MNQVSTYTAQIFVGLRAGYSEEVHSLDDVREVCRAYVNSVGLCVTVTPTEFIYVDGGEPGAVVGLINYPRFPSTPADIEFHALELARRLKEALGQNRVSVVFPHRTVMIE